MYNKIKYTMNICVHSTHHLYIISNKNEYKIWICLRQKTMNNLKLFYNYLPTYIFMKDYIIYILK